MTKDTDNTGKDSVSSSSQHGEKNTVASADDTTVGDDNVMKPGIPSAGDDIDYSGVKPPTKQEKKHQHMENVKLGLIKDPTLKEKAYEVAKYVFPIMVWIPEYNLQENLLGDVISGITVGVMLVPQGMAYSLLATLPPEYGLYSSTIPIFVYSIFGSSKHLAVGPVAVVSLLIAEALAGAIPEEDPSAAEKKLDLAIILALLAGLVSVGMALFRAGVVANFISHAVLIGFTSGAAVVIALSQLKHLLGFKIPRFDYPLETLIYALKHIQFTKKATVTMGIVAILLLLIMRYTKRWWANKPVNPDGKSETLQAVEKWTKRIVKLICNLGALVVVVIGTLVTEYLYKEHGYSNTTSLPIVGYVPEGIPSPRVPPVGDYGDDIPNLFVSALVISILGFMESYAVADTYARKVGSSIDANQELSGLGVANLIGSFFNAFPVTGGFSRTAVQFDSGCKSPIAMIISALVVIIALVALTQAFFYMPNNVLAAIIFVAVSGLFNMGAVRESWYVARADFWAMIITFIGTIGLGVEIGLAVGFAASVILILQRLAFPHTAILGEIQSKTTGEPIYRNLLRFPEARTFNGVIIFRIDAPLWFASTGKFLYKMAKFCEDESVHTIIVDFSSIDFIDLAGLEILAEVQHMLEKRKVSFIAAAVKGPVRDSIAAYNKYGKHHPGSSEILPWTHSSTDNNFMVATLHQAVQVVEGNMKPAASVTLV